MKNISQLLLTLFMTVSGPTYAASNVVTVNGVGISQNVFNQTVQDAIKNGAKDTPELREAIKSQMITDELLYQEAQKQRLDRNPDVVRTVEAAKRQLMVEFYIAKFVKPQPVTDSAVKEEYENYKARQGSQEYRLRAIRTAAETAAQNALKQIKSGQDFTVVAQKVSGGSNATWISFKTPAQEGKTNGLPLPLAQAVEKMRQGEVSPVIYAENSWWIIKLEESRPTKVLPFDEIKQEIRQLLTARASDAAVSAKLNALAKQAKIQ